VAVSNLIRLLDLPQEALALVERGGLTEGHGRAILLAPDHADRRRLARDAAAGDWSVRELERRARAAGEAGGKPRTRTRPAVHPDQQDGIDQLTDAFDAVDAAVRVTAQGDGGYRVQLAFDSLDAALALARRLGVRSPV
jgi:ParB family chromosome partitioning protein